VTHRLLKSWHQSPWPDGPFDLPLLVGPFYPEPLLSEIEVSPLFAFQFPFSRGLDRDFYPATYFPLFSSRLSWMLNQVLARAPGLEDILFSIFAGPEVFPI